MLHLNKLKMSEDDNLVKLFYKKANELFKICDEERKGFIIKKDMQKIKSIVNLTPEALEDVFNSLDQEKNGYLTIDQFINRFKDFFGFINKNQNDDEYEISNEIFKETIVALGANDFVDE
jgi:Ca2+-binding EF-hand superfamily protein